MPAAYTSCLLAFASAERQLIEEQLAEFVRAPSAEQIKAWHDSVELLQPAARELHELIEKDTPGLGAKCSVLLECRMPFEERRMDALLLLNGAIVVVEFKGRAKYAPSDLDQTAAYARDLRLYHEDGGRVRVAAVLVPALATSLHKKSGEVHIVDHRRLAGVCAKLHRVRTTAPLEVNRFLDPAKYRPLPGLLQSARAFFHEERLPQVKRAAAATDPTVARVTKIIAGTASRNRRALILISGVPGAGKTLVGLQLAHADYSKLRNIPSGGAAVAFLSGNAALVKVLQHSLRGGGGAGKPFVRQVYSFIGALLQVPGSVPHENILVYDEAQRAFDAAAMAKKHNKLPEQHFGKTEPDLLVDLAGRVPSWSVIVALIGSGQKIHVGEEGGLELWARALAAAPDAGNWDVYLPGNLEADFGSPRGPRIEVCRELSLDQSIRFHLADKLHDFVRALLHGDARKASAAAKGLHKNGHRFHVTRRLDTAKSHLRRRYEGQPDARFGLVASSRDTSLHKHGVDNRHDMVKDVPLGPWYAAPSEHADSCCALKSVLTEFETQGLELDAALLAWGEDYVREANDWTDRHAKGYAKGTTVTDPLALRTNSYRVLLTRGRDSTVVFIPATQRMDETYEFLLACGMTPLE